MSYVVDVLKAMFGFVVGPFKSDFVWGLLVGVSFLVVASLEWDYVPGWRVLVCVYIGCVLGCVLEYFVKLYKDSKG